MADVDIQHMIKEVESLGKTFTTQTSSTKLEADRIIANLNSCFSVIDNTLQNIKAKDDIISKRLERLEQYYRTGSPQSASIPLQNVDPFEDDESLDELASIAFFGRSKSIPSITIRSPRSPRSPSKLSPSPSSESLYPPSAPSPPPPPIMVITAPASPTSSSLDLSSVKLKSAAVSTPSTPRVQSPADALMSEMASKLLTRKSPSFNNLESALKKSPEKKLSKSAEMSASSPNFRLLPSISAVSPNSPRDIPFVTDVVIPYADLKNRKNLSADVNVAALEAYLSQGEFFKVFGMSRESFNKLPRWQKDNKKKAVNLY